ncbi:MAG: cell division protein FtsZ [Thermoplasmata archaeon]
MKSIITDALSRRGAEGMPLALAQPSAPAEPGADDRELEEILQGMKVRIKVFGCGGGGSNTINRLVEAGVLGAELFALNTDAKHLLTVHAQRKFLLGKRLTRGLGAGAIPQVGEEAAREAEEEIKPVMANTDIAFITCGMGGGTGTGAAPVIAKMAKDAGALVIGVVTMPFHAEGAMRMQNALEGLERLEKVADTVIVVPNDKLLQLVPRLPLDQAFKVADEVLMLAIKGITEVVTKPGLVNLDFSDLKTIMKGGGVAMIGMGEGEGDEKANDAIQEALNSPLLDVDISEATGALISVTGGPDMTVAEAEKMAEIVGSRINPMARIIWGCSVDPSLEHGMKVLLVVTGVKSRYQLSEISHRAEKGLEFLR